VAPFNEAHQYRSTIKEERINTEMNTVRLLGAAQVIYFVGFLITGVFLVAAVGSGSISDILVNVSKKPTLMRISNLVALGLGLATVVLGVLYYIVFNKEYQIIALVALGCFLVAAITFTVGTIGANALIPLSQKFVEAGAPEASYFQTLGDFLYNGVHKRGSDIQTLFSILGFLLVNYLLYTSGYIPRALSIWGLAAVFLALIPALLQLYEPDFFPPAQILGLPFVPY
jgi:hypothetical protein